MMLNNSQDITVSWKKNGTNINQIPGRYEIGLSQLLIINVRKTDEGVYTCTGSSSTLPSASATVNLQVECKSMRYFIDCLMMEPMQEIINLYVIFCSLYFW